MFYEIAIKVTKADERGKEKEVVERFITDVMLFAEAEQKGLELYNGQCDVVGIRRSNVYEIVNENANKEKYFRAKLGSIFIDENSGKEKMTYYHVLLSADNMDEANKIMQEYMNAGMADFLLMEIKETKILEVI